MKNYKLLAFSITILLSYFLYVEFTSALTYQSSADVNFTFNPVISLTVGGDLLINNLTPGNSSDSNVIDVSVTTNASYGYVLSATVGQKNGTDSLVNTSNNTYTFTNLSTTAGSAATLNNFTDNKWGYSYSVDNGTNWISGSVGSTASGYAGLPLDNNNNAEDRGLGGVTLIDTSNPADNKTIKFKIGAKAANTQAAGAYTNTINFYVVANAVPVSFNDAFLVMGKTKMNGYYKIQDATASICSSVTEDEVGQLIDSRDGTVYKVGKLGGGNCWMLDNLSLDLTDSNVQAVISSSNTNASDTALGYLINGGGSGQYPASAVSSTWATSSTLPYIEKGYKNNIAPVAYGVGSGKIGIYYNFCSASGGSYCYSSFTGSPSEDICPINWSIIQPDDLDAYTVSYGGNATAFQTAFSANYSGDCQSSGQTNVGSAGEWWSLSLNTNYGVVRPLRIKNSLVSFDNNDGRPNRYVGYNIRCVLHTQ